MEPTTEETKSQKVRENAASSLEALAAAVRAGAVDAMHVRFALGIGLRVEALAVAAPQAAPRRQLRAA